MSEKFIPEHIDPFRYAEQDLHLEGAVKLADMQRLPQHPAGNDEVAHVNLRFGLDEQGLAYLKGHLQAKLMLQCQRCLEPFTYEIISDFVLGIVKTLDDANALPDRYEPAVAGADGQLALRELIEDEIILNLPIIPRHETDTCKVSLPIQVKGLEEEKGNNPFHVLKSLKQKQK